MNNRTLKVLFCVFSLVLMASTSFSVAAEVVLNPANNQNTMNANVISSSFSPSANSKDPTSTNWAGYEVVSSFTNPQPVFGTIYGSWVVESVAGHYLGGTTKAFQWIGIGGGHSGDPLIQVGTSSIANAFNNNVFEAWYEMLPVGGQAGNSSAVQVFSVSAGDVINAYISGNSAHTQWTIFIYDTTNGHSYQNTFTYSPDMSIAEWIEEKNNSYNLAKFGTADYGPQYTNGYSNRVFDTSNATLYTINSLPHYEVTMQDSSGTTLAQPSSLGSDGNSFTITWKAAS